MAIIFEAFLLVAICFSGWLLLSERVCVIGGAIQKKYGRKSEILKLSELKEVRYSYHAVVGFIAVWEFIDQYGKEVVVSSKARGLSSTLLALETTLPGFSLGGFKKQFEGGDVEDSFVVWRSHD